METKKKVFSSFYKRNPRKEIVKHSIIVLYFSVVSENKKPAKNAIRFQTRLDFCTASC